MPLNISGEEAVLMKVWKHFGLQEEEIRESFTGPPFLPWNRMMDIDRWKGPLPQKFIDRQEALQKKILQRERELNMKPVLPAFNGKVPAAFARLYPEAHIKEAKEKHDQQSLQRAELALQRAVTRIRVYDALHHK